MSWSLGEVGRRVVVMWDVPFFQSHNILAVGISTTENTVHKENWYTEIEKLSQSSDLNYSRERYYETCNEVMIADERIEVLGTMGTGRAPEVNITVRANPQ